MLFAERKMKNRNGISWGPDKPVNLVKIKSGKYKAVAHNIFPPEVIKIYICKNSCDFFNMLKELDHFNYGTCKLCPVVKMDMDFTN